MIPARGPQTRVGAIIDDADDGAGMAMMIVMMVMISMIIATFFFLDLAAQGRCYRLHMLCSLLCSRAAQKW